jgi:hypothetical protein
VSEVRSKASVGLFAMLVAHFDTQPFLDIKFESRVVDFILFVG